MKRGPMGCVVFPGEIPDYIENGVKGPGFPVEVYNVLGAGDAFMSGFLRGWLREEPLETLLRLRQRRRRLRGIAAAVLGGISDLGGAAAIPRPGLAASRAAPRRRLNHIHWATTRRAEAARASWRWRSTIARNSKKIADEADAPRERIGAIQAARGRRRRARWPQGRPGYGMLLDGKYGREALFRAADHNFWIGRPVEEPGSRPLDFEFGGSLGAKLIEWPIAHTIKCLCFYHPDDSDEMKARQERELLRLLRRGAHARARIADRNHRQQARPGRRRHGGARDREAL